MARVRTLSALLAVSGLVAGGLAAAGTAQAGTTHQSAAHRSLRSIHLQASYAHMPTSKQHKSGGAVNLSEAGSLQRYVNRSNSPRPAVKTVHGATVMATPAAWVPKVKPTPVSTKRPNTVTGWQGLNENDNQTYAGFSLEPPDQGLCVGNGHVFEMINDVVRVYSTAGAPQHQPVYLNDFFSEPGYQFTTDPSCTYDAGSGRFFATELTLDVDPNTGNLTGNDWLDLAVSKTGNPLGGWNVYRIYVTDDGTNGTPIHSGCPCIGDFPHLATDANGVYLTTNEYPFGSDPGEFGNNFNGAQLYALGKDALVAGSPTINVVDFQNTQIPTDTGAPREVGFTLWPAQAAGNGYDMHRNGTEYFVSSLAAEEARPDDFTGHSSQIAAWWLHNTASLNTETPAPTLRVKVLDVGAYGIPALAMQKVGPTPLKDCLNVQCVSGPDPYTPEEEGGLDSSDTRPLTAVFARGHVYAALDTTMQINGSLQSGFEWFSIGAHGVKSRITKRGYVGVKNGNVIYPTIATNKAGKGYLGVTLAGAKWFPSAAYAQWNGAAGPTINVAKAGAAPEDGFCEYVAFNCAQTPTPAIRPRWGDYGYAAWDGNQFYVANEYIAKRCTFAVFNVDHTCGGTRTFYGNFSTHIEVLH